jgi:UDP-N-acetylglucosamine--N-acetylmuramyl-(pentapeptide) pyrophosphoryl-undecaprenol N-acetylglucosamine transferase
MPAWSKFFPKEKVLLTGNPVRQEVVRLQGSILVAWNTSGWWKDEPILFITGGSLGARGVNHGIEAALASWKAAGMQVIWQTGTPFFQASEGCRGRTRLHGLQGALSS